MYRIHPRTAPTPTPIFAGGGSVPATMLRNWGDAYGVPIQQPALPSRPNVELLYASSSGGSGQRYFLDQAFDLVSPIAPKPVFTDTTNGRNFTYPYPNASGAAGAPDFSIGSQLSIADHQTYRQTDKARGKPVVVPLIETAMALIYNLGPYSTLGSRTFMLSRKSYCGIFEGTITDWSDPQISADNGGPVVGQSTTIDVVYRSDGSGTTFMLTAHLNHVCSRAGYPYSQGVGETFNLPNPQPVGSSFVPANGGAAEAAAVLTPLTGHGALGYVTPSLAKPLSPSGPPAANVVNHANMAIFPTAQSAFEAVNFGPFNKPPPGYPQTSPESYVLDPSASDAYPIVGMVTMYFYGCYPSADADIPAMKAFFTQTLLPAFGGPPTFYDNIAQLNGLGQMPDRMKSKVLHRINSIQQIAPSSQCVQMRDS